MANRVSISSLEEAENDAELAADEPNLIELRVEIMGQCILRDDDTGIFRSPLAKRDSIWLSAAIPDVSSPSGQSSNKSSGASKAESALLRNSIPEVKDLVSRYSVLVENDVRQASQPDSMVNTNEGMSKTPRSPAPRQTQELSHGRYGRKITGEWLPRHPLNSQQKELHPIDHEDTRRFAIHTAIPVPNEEPPPESASDLKKKDRFKLPEHIARQERPCKIPDVENLEGVLAALRRTDFQDFLVEVSATGQWFRVLSSGELLACLHRYLHCMKDFRPQLIHLLGQMFRDFHNSEGLGHFDLKTFQTIEKERIRAISDEYFVDELWATTMWFANKCYAKLRRF